MVSFRVVADSTADTPPEWDVPFVPVHVYAGINEFLDKVEFTANVLRDLAEKGIKRRTSAPSVKDWMRKFEEIGKDLPVMAITISSKLSASFKSAEIAARMLQKKGYTIKVFDSWNGSIGIGLLIKYAKEMSEKVVDIDTALARLNELRERVRTYLVVSDMDAAARSGRIPALVGKIGKFLNLHPIFVTINGEIKLLKTVHGMQHVINEFHRLIEGRKEVWVGVVGRNNYADELWEYVKSKGLEGEYLNVDPAIGAHFGYGAFGIAFIED